MSSHDFSKYPPEQRAAYLGAIAALMTADRQASEAEVQFLSALAKETGLQQAEAQRVVDAALDPSGTTLKADLDGLKGSDLRFSLMHDLSAFAQSDGDYSEAEQAQIASMAKYLGITPEQVDAVDQYQAAAAGGKDTSGAASALGDLGMPKGGGMLASVLAAVGPAILQQILARSSGGAPGSGGAGPGGGLMGVLGQVMGGMSGGAPGAGAPGGGGPGGLMGVLGQVMGAMGGGGAGAPPQTSGGGMGGLGQILQVLGQMQGGAGQPGAPSAPQGGGFGAVSGMLGRLFGGR